MTNFKNYEKIKNLIRTVNNLPIPQNQTAQSLLLISECNTLVTNFEQLIKSDLKIESVITYMKESFNITSGIISLADILKDDIFHGLIWQFHTSIETLLHADYAKEYGKLWSIERRITNISTELKKRSSLLTH